ncbi:DUF4214 domain-containing protein [Cupriavidus basilensis]
MSGRPGDTPGVNYWAQQFAEGTRTVDDFAWGAYQEQVKKAYKDVMGREADAAGLDYYTRQMQAGRPLSEIIKDMQYAKLDRQRMRMAAAPTCRSTGTGPSCTAGERVLTSRTTGSSPGQSTGASRSGAAT